LVFFSIMVTFSVFGFLHTLTPLVDPVRYR
jgi:hypothetical protein